MPVCLSIADGTHLPVKKAKKRVAKQAKRASMA
jgi:hypothetical protein